MRKFLLFLLSAVCYGSFVACNTATPEKYFDVAVLSSNMMHGFASSGGALHRELESPSVKMVDGNKDKVETMKRKEVIENKIQVLEANQGKLQRLKETSDTKDILQASHALYNYVLPVYKNEYRELARLYDENASKEQIQSYAQSIQDKYFQTFLQLNEKLTAVGKAFADRNNIAVNWGIRTSPR